MENQSPQLWHELSPEEVARTWSVDVARGLSAMEVQQRRAKHGTNTLPQARRRSLWTVFARQFKSPLIYILFIAAGLAFFVGERTDALVILLVVMVNAVIGTFQEGRAERSMEALRKLSALRVRVRRDGQTQEIEARELVPGDILVLASGDAVGADARVVEAAAMEAAEAALTGESIPVAKQPQPLPTDTEVADRSNMAYSGTHVAAGRGQAVVVAIGQETEVGKIAHLAESTKETRTPLELRLHQFGHYLVVAAIGIFILVVAIGLVRRIPLTEIFMVAISQMVSMVPEGLPVALTIALAVGMQRMAARGAIVRRLAAVETLGSTSVICTDKTGTLTRNEMTVTTLWLPSGRLLQISGTGYTPEGELREQGQRVETLNDPPLRALLEGAALCNDAQLLAPDSAESGWRIIGDPTEAALLTLARKAGFDLNRLHHDWPRRAEIPFDSSVKMMATHHENAQRLSRVYLKGAPELIRDLCRDVPPTAHAAGDQMAQNALRVLAVAQIEGVGIDLNRKFDQFKGNASFLGLIGQMDPPREEGKGAVQQCRDAGIRPVLVTGDHKTTALAIARMLDLARPEDGAIDGRELESMSDSALADRLDRLAVFARVHPAQKLRIVEAFQRRGHVVAMTGDGVNDAPALARADVGVAMGISGTEAAKSAARVVITDDNFATIVKAVEGGRLVYQNLQKVILFLFTTSLDEVIVLLLALVLGYPLPLAAVQILWINIVTEGTLTLNLIMEPLEGDEMKRSPISSRERLVTVAMLRRMALLVPTSVCATFGYFLWRFSSGAALDQVRTETFTLLAVCQWFNILNCESATQSAFRLTVWKNKWLLGGLILSNLLQLAVIYLPPLNKLFHTTPIPLPYFFLIGAVASSVLWVEEIRKWIARKRGS